MQDRKKLIEFIRTGKRQQIDAKNLPYIDRGKPDSVCDKAKLFLENSSWYDLKEEERKSSYKKRPEIFILQKEIEEYAILALFCVQDATEFEHWPRWQRCWILINEIASFNEEHDDDEESLSN